MCSSELLRSCLYDDLFSDNSIKNPLAKTSNGLIFCVFQVGAGIQIPPNGARVCRSLGILEKLERNATILEQIFVRRYSDGQVLGERLLGDRCIARYGSPWL